MKVSKYCHGKEHEEQVCLYGSHQTQSNNLYNYTLLTVLNSPQCSFLLSLFPKSIKNKYHILEPLDLTAHTLDTLLSYCQLSNTFFSPHPLTPLLFLLLPLPSPTPSRQTPDRNQLAVIAKQHCQKTRKETNSVDGLCYVCMMYRSVNEQLNVLCYGSMHVT